MHHLERNNGSGVIITETKLLIIFFAMRLTEAISVDKSIDLCSNLSGGYNYYTTLRTDSCGCELCVRKCCRKGFFYHQDITFTKQYCIRNYSANFSVPIYENDTKLYDLDGEFAVGMLNCTGRKLRHFDLDTISNFYLQQNGSLYYSLYKTKYNYMDYCIDGKDRMAKYYFCGENEFVIPMSVKVINEVFLVITTLAFASIPERNNHRNAVTFHTMCLVIANIILDVEEYYNIEGGFLCCKGCIYSFLVYLLLYFRYASDFWLNVICIDVWHTFRRLHAFFRLSDKKKIIFVTLSIYACGMPGLTLVVVILLKSYGREVSNYYPRFGMETCSFGGVSSQIFYYGPKLILIICNTILNTITVINIQTRKHRNETSIVTRFNNKWKTCIDDPRFSLYWKLLFITTYDFINLLHLVLLFAYAAPTNPRFVTYLNYYGEIFRVTYGMAFFITFVCKKLILDALKQRYLQVLEKLKLCSDFCRTTRITRTAASENGISLTTFNSTK